MCVTWSSRTCAARAIDIAWRAWSESMAGAAGAGRLALSLPCAGERT